MKPCELIFHAIFTGIVAIFTFAILNIGDDPEPIYYLITFLFAGIFRMVFIYVTEVRKWKQ